MERTRGRGEVRGMALHALITDNRLRKDHRRDYDCIKRYL